MMRYKPLFFLLSLLLPFLLSAVPLAENPKVEDPKEDEFLETAGGNIPFVLNQELIATNSKAPSSVAQVGVYSVQKTYFKVLSFQYVGNRGDPSFFLVVNEQNIARGKDEKDKDLEGAPARFILTLLNILPPTRARVSGEIIAKLRMADFTTATPLVIEIRNEGSVEKIKTWSDLGNYFFKEKKKESDTLELNVSNIKSLEQAAKRPAAALDDVRNAFR